MCPGFDIKLSVRHVSKRCVPQTYIAWIWIENDAIMPEFVCQVGHRVLD